MDEDALRLARLIDHTLVRPDATLEDLDRACAEARQYGFAALIVNSAQVTRARNALAGSPVRVGSVVGFPHGTCTTTVKIVEAMEAMKNGAVELDIMVNTGLVRSGRHDLAEIDIKNVIAMTRGVVHKAILETGLLTREEIVSLCRIVVRSGAEFVKICSGYGPRGATIDDVTLIREIVGATCAVKASGGIRDYETLQAMVAAGADRVGTSAGPAIMESYLKKRG